MSQPLFTVATITYNSSKWVRECIESVLASRYIGFEYIISDDCSTDDTWEIIREYSDPRIVRWQNEKNLGEYPNRQKVLDAATGKYILYIDGDDMLYKDTLQRYFWYLEEFTSVKAIWGVDYVNYSRLKFPHIFSGKEILRENYLKNSTICFVGLAESLFEIDALKSLSGFVTDFAIGDTLIKKKFACYFDILVIPTGVSFWRQHEAQASKVKTAKYIGFIQNFKIDREILYSYNNPLSDSDLRLAKRYFKARSIKLLVRKTLLKGRVFDFFKIRSELKMAYTYLFYLFVKTKG